MNTTASIKRFWNCCLGYMDAKKTIAKIIPYGKLLSTLWTSCIWKDITNVRQIILLHMHQEDSGKWVWMASQNDNSLFPQHGILSEVHHNLLTYTIMCGFLLTAPKWITVSSKPWMMDFSLQIDSSIFQSLTRTFVVFVARSQKQFSTYSSPTLIQHISGLFVNWNWVWILQCLLCKLRLLISRRNSQRRTNVMC